MLLRDRLQTALKEAMKAKEADRLSTLRLINAAIKDREIAVRGEADAGEVGEPEILQIMGKMVKQRQESARAYEEGGRLELAEKELAEIGGDPGIPATADGSGRGGGRRSIRRWPRRGLPASATWAKVMAALKARYTARWISARSVRW
jgi:hypothetical protein